MEGDIKILQIKNLSFKYDKEYILKDINLEVNKGDFLAIIGPNGGGKSTLVKLILSFLKPTKGTIKLYSTNIGYVPQNTDINLDFPITALEVVMLGHKNNSNNFFKKVGFWYKEDEISCAKNSLKLGSKNIKLNCFLKNKATLLRGNELPTST